MKLPRTIKNSLERLCLSLLPLLVLSLLGRWPAAIAVTGCCRLSSSACDAFPALAGGIRLLAYVPCLSREVAYPPQ